MTAKANGSFNGEDVDFEGGLILLSDRAYVNYKGTEYEVDPTTFSFVKSALEKAQQQGGAQGKSAGATACQEAVSDLKVGDFVDNLSNEGSADVGGTTTTKVSGDLNVPGAIDALLEADRRTRPAAPSLAPPARCPPKPNSTRPRPRSSSALKTAHVDVYVGDDNIVRRIAAAADDRTAERVRQRAEEGRPRLRPDARRGQRGTDDRRALRREAAQRSLLEAGRQPDRTARRPPGQGRARRVERGRRPRRPAQRNRR